MMNLDTLFSRIRDKAKSLTVESDFLKEKGLQEEGEILIDLIKLVQKYEVISSDWTMTTSGCIDGKVRFRSTKSPIGKATRACQKNEWVEVYGPLGTIEVESAGEIQAGDQVYLNQDGKIEKA